MYVIVIYLSLGKYQILQFPHPCGKTYHFVGFKLTAYIGVASIMQYRHMRNKKSNTQGSSPNVVKELLLKERICSLWEQILSFKRSSHFEKGRNWKESLLDTVVSLW